MARQVERASAALQDGEGELHSGRFSEAAEKLRSGETLLEDVPFCIELHERIGRARELAERGQAAVELHALLERLRPLFCTEEVSISDLKTAESSCLKLWSERLAIAQRLEGQATPELERQWRADLLDVGVLFSHLAVRLADPNEILLARRKSMDVLAEAEAFLGPSAGLYLERASQARALGQRFVGEESSRAGNLLAATTWEQISIARTHLIAGNPRLAAEKLDHCLKNEPSSLWANYYRGICSLRLGEFDEAAAYFTACVSLAPGSGWCAYQRGVAYREMGRLDRARSDFERALALNPGLSIASVALARINSRGGSGTIRRERNREESHSK